MVQFNLSPSNDVLKRSTSALNTLEESRPSHYGELARLVRRTIYTQGFQGTTINLIAESSDFTTADLEEFFPNSEALLLLSLKVERKELSQQLKQLGQSGIEPALRLAEFVLLKEAQSQDLARYGCPIGSLISELGKNELQLKDRVSELSFLQLDWLREQFTRLLVELNSSAQFSTKRDIEKASLALASKLFAMIQGFVLVAQSQEDESWLRKQLKVLSQDLKQKRFLSQVL